MSLLVDTSVWSLSLRRKSLRDEDTAVIQRLAKAIRDLDVVMIGPIRQEILSGIKDKGRFEELRTRLGIFTDEQIATTDYELAAEFYNTSRQHGIQGSHIDFLICAVAVNHRLKIFTLDADFGHYQRHLPIEIERIA
ncbi:MAG: PIN domain-containing protein [Candidatus Competibacteraceae bacterium]|nr:PIN domain-containing protein [Candidatus Competibacteraceae bacterium]